jgi:hypothetical protein
MPEVEESEELYAPPTHLTTSGSVGAIPERTFWVMFAAIVAGGIPATWGYQRFGKIGLLLWLIPVLLAIPFALPFLSPPFEHGLFRLPRHRFSRKVKLHQHHPWLQELTIEDGVSHVGGEVRAVLSAATVNLDLASVVGKRRHRRQIGLLLDGVSYPLQVVIRSETQPFVTSLERMRLNRNPHARRLADWLATHHKTKQAIERRRYLIAPAPNVDVHEERVINLMRSFTQANLAIERVKDDADLREIVNNFWTWRPHPERIGPDMVINHARELQADGVFVRIYALSKLPSTIVTNWWHRLPDGDMPLDMSIYLEQQDLELAKWRLDLKLNNLMSSPFHAKRDVAIAQVRQLRRDMEGRTRPWNMQVLFLVRGADKPALEKACATFEQQIKDLSAQVKLLRWEQYDGMVSAQPLCLGSVPQRPLYLESGTVARCSAFSASKLQMLDGVPWGMAGSAPILLTTKNSKTGHHFGVFGFPGSGKGYAIRMYLARRHFADRLRIFAWDSDDVAHEYSGRFCEFLRGISLKLNSLEAMKAVELDPAWQVVVADVSEMPDHERSAAFAHWKHLVEKHVLEFPGDTAFLVDEATEIAEAPDQVGAIALGHAVQTWRKRGVEVHILTQRVSDWYGTRIGRKIQGNLAVKIYGAQEESEIYDVAQRVRWSDEERERIAAAGIGQFLVVAFGRRVWADLYEQAAEFEHNAYETDPPERVEILATRRVA